MNYRRLFKEYFKGDEIINPDLTGNGKKLDRINSRKHMNTKPLEYTHMHPDVDAVAKNKADGKMVKGVRLQQLLNMYNIEPTPGTKGLGRSHAVLVLKQAPEGLVGYIKQK